MKRRFALVVGASLVLAASGTAIGQETLELTKGSIEFDVLYWDDDVTSSSYCPLNEAQEIRDAIDLAYDVFTAAPFGFQTPWVTSLPDFNVTIYDASNIGGASPSGISIDAPNLLVHAECRGRATLLHELFHTVQYSYNHSRPGVQRWAREGTARAIEDRTFADHDSTPACTLFLGEVNDYLAAPNQYLFGLDNPYKGGLFFAYAAEQLGNVAGEPERGIDFLRGFWERVQDTANNDTDDAIAELKETVAAFAVGKDVAGNFDDFFRDFGIANYAHDLDVAALPNSARYRYVDETAAGGGSAYDAVARDVVGIESSGALVVSRYGNAYLQVNASLTAECGVMGFHGEADQKTGWAVVGVKSGNRAASLEKAKGRSFYGALLQPSSDPFEKLAAVVTGLENSSNVTYQFARGAVKITIRRPTLARQALAGPHGSPGRFVVCLRVSGVPELTPEGGHSVKGLNYEDFGVAVADRPAEVISGAYVGGDYWLVVQAPDPGADGAYHLTVSLCGQTARSIFSVLYGDAILNQVIVLDKSGSMTLPSETRKIDAARVAAALFVDATRTGDRLGVVTFNGNHSECDDDAQLLRSLGDVNLAARAAAHAAISGVTASGMTSIGDGIAKAEVQLDDKATTDLDLRYTILLSDGMENEGRFWDATNLCGGGSEEAVRPGVLASGTVIHAIAFGPETNQELMDEIAADTLGDYTYVDVSEGAGAGDSGGETGAGATVPPSSLVLANRLASAYATISDRIGGRQRLVFFAETVGPRTPLEEKIPVTENDIEDATFFFNWPDAKAGVAVELSDPAGATVTESSHPVEIFETATHKVYQFQKRISAAPKPWLARIASTASTQVMGGLSGKLANGVRFDLLFGQLTGPGSIPPRRRFLAGMPVQLVAMLTDRKGAISGARVAGEVERPDRTRDAIQLFDDGGHDDGGADDGVYGAAYTRTDLASRGGVPDDQSGKDPGQRGSYVVSLVATGTSNAGEPFTRYAEAGFPVTDDPELNPDPDRDGLPSRWEIAHGLDPQKPDADQDPDRDGLPNGAEFRAGTDPHDPDTDDGGEMDGSEVERGANPLEPSDDIVCKVTSFSLVTRVADGDREGVRPVARANVLVFSVPLDLCRPRVHIFRAVGAPEKFQEIASPAPGDKAFGTHVDRGLEVGVPHYYYLQVELPSGQMGPPTDTLVGIPLDDPVPPEGWVSINCGALRTDSLDALVGLDLSSGAKEYVLSATPDFSGARWVALREARVPFRLSERGAVPGWRHVYCRYRNASGAESYAYSASILFDPAGDADRDRIQNGQDPDDDGDGVSDRDEIDLHCTDPFDPDTDGDGLSDGEEVKAGTNPRSSDTDGDGLTDKEDPDPLKPTAALQRPGDCNQDNRLDISDGACMLGYLFLGNPQRLPCGRGSAEEPSNVRVLDANADEKLDLSDPLYLLGFLFLGGPPPVQGLGCIAVSGCPNVCR